MMSEVNVLWSSAWLKLQKNLAGGSRLGESSVAGMICNRQAQHTVASAGSWLVRAPRGIVQESSLSQ
jgi:hypothetical protein